MSGAKSDRVLHLENMTHAAVKRLDPSRTFVLATLSPIEVHGPHLPLGQDYFEAYALAESAATYLAGRREDWTFLLLPPVPIGADCVPHPGSVPFPVRVVQDVAYHLLEPFARAGFARLGYSGFHGGPRHNCALEAAAARLWKRFGTPCASLFSMVLASVLEGTVFHDAIRDVPGSRITLEQLKADRHAGFVETSLALHLWPELVEDGWSELPGLAVLDEKAQADGSYLFDQGGAESFADRTRRRAATVRSIFRAIKHFVDKTYYGYPDLSSEAAGKALLDHLTGLAAQAAEDLIDRPDEVEVHSPLWKLHKVLLNPAVNKAADGGLRIYTDRAKKAVT